MANWLTQHRVLGLVGRALLLLMALASLTVTGTRSQATTLTPAQQQLQQILAQRAYWERRLRAAQTGERAVEVRLSATQNALSGQRARLAQEQARASTQRARLVAAIQADENRVAAVQTQMEASRTEYQSVHHQAAGLLRRLHELKVEIHQELRHVRAAIVQMYDISRVSPLQAMLTAHTLTDYLQQQGIVTEIGQRDTAVLQQARAQHVAVLRVASVYIEKMRELRVLESQEKAQLALVIVETQHEDVLLLQAQRMTARRQATIRHQEASVATLAAQEQQQLSLVAGSAQAAASEISQDQSAAEQVALIIGRQTGTIPDVGGAPGTLQWPVQGVITQGFGPTTFSLEPPLDYGGVYYAHFHTGLDIAAPYETPVHAAAAGRVIFSSFIYPSDPHVGYGLCVIIMHTTHLATLYAHLDSALGLTVKPGDLVAAGQVIGYIGVTGNTTGPHLHFEVRVDGQFENPLAYLPRQG